MTEWQWWDWSFALKLLWHGFVFTAIATAIVSAFAFRWAWRRGVEIDNIRKQVQERAEEKLAEERETRIH